MTFFGGERKRGVMCCAKTDRVIDLVISRKGGREAKINTISLIKPLIIHGLRCTEHTIRVNV